jgi:GT2 family glycosyltransferase
MPRISLVVPTRDRPAALARCLAAVAASFPDDAETIVVDDGGSADLEPAIAPHRERLRLRLLAGRGAGPAAARNRALDAAQGEIVAFTDDDCRPGAGWLAALADGVALSPPRAVGGATRNGLPQNAYADTAQLVLELLSRYDRQASRRERFLPSNNFALPAEALRRLGGFDESFRTAEDRELCRRWAAAGYELARVPAAVVEHDAELDLARFLRQFAAYGRGAARFHRGGADPSLRESAAFHVRLPRLLLPELARRGVRRGAAVAALLVVWELANLAGFAAEWSRRRGRANRAAPLASGARIPESS